MSVREVEVSLGNLKYSRFAEGIGATTTTLAPLYIEKLSSS